MQKQKLKYGIFQSWNFNWYRRLNKYKLNKIELTISTFYW